MQRIEIIPSFEEIQAKYKKQAEKITDFKDLWDEIIKDFGKIEILVFASRGAYAGVTWKPLSKRYMKQKQKKYAGKGLLVRTGTLRSRMIKGGWPLKTKNKLIISVAHNVTTPKQLEKRPLINYNFTVAHRWEKIVSKWLEKQVSTDGV